MCLTGRWQWSIGPTWEALENRDSERKHHRTLWLTKTDVEPLSNSGMYAKNYLLDPKEKNLGVKEKLSLRKFGAKSSLPDRRNVGKYQNGTSYTRVSDRHNWDARAPLWVNVSEGFRAKNVLSPSSLPFHCWSWEQVFFATVDRVRVPALFLTIINFTLLKFPTQSETIVANFIQQEVQ